jgi:hypothetical protein
MNEAVILWLRDKKQAVESWNFEKVIKKIRHYDLICNYCGEAIVFVKDKRGHAYFKHKGESCLL